MKAYIIFYLLTSFCLGGTLVYSTLGYIPQTITMLFVGVLSIFVGLFFKKYSK